MSSPNGSDDMPSAGNDTEEDPKPIHESTSRLRGLAGPSARLNESLARLGGAGGKTPHSDADVRRFTLVGCLILLVATIAILSTTLSLAILANAPLYVALPIGTLFGILICLFDTVLVATAVRPHEARRYLLATPIRVAGALIIGGMIWASALTYLFDADIDRIRIEVASQQEYFQRIPTLEAERRKHQEVVASGVNKSILDIKEVQDLDTEVKQRESYYLATNQALITELAGRSLSRQPGDGPVADQIRLLLAEQKQQLSDVQARFNDAAKRASDAVKIESDTAKSTAADDLKRVNEDLVQLHDEPA